MSPLHCHLSPAPRLVFFTIDRRLTWRRIIAAGCSLVDRGFLGCALIGSHYPKFSLDGLHDTGHLRLDFAPGGCRVPLCQFMPKLRRHQDSGLCRSRHLTKVTQGLLSEIRESHSLSTVPTHLIKHHVAKVEISAHEAYRQSLISNQTQLGKLGEKTETEDERRRMKLPHRQAVHIFIQSFRQ